MEAILKSLTEIHSALRWLILSLAVFGAARSFVSVLSVSARFSRLDVGVSRAYAVLLDVQLAVGALLALALGTMQWPIHWIHPLIMLAPTVAANLTFRFATRPDRKRHQAQLAIYLGSLVLVVIGLAIIGQLSLPG